MFAHTLQSTYATRQCAANDAVLYAMLMVFRHRLMDSKKKCRMASRAVNTGGIWTEIKSEVRPAQDKLN